MVQPREQSSPEAGPQQPSQAEGADEEAGQGLEPPTGPEATGTPPGSDPSQAKPPGPSNP